MKLERLFRVVALLGFVGVLAVASDVIAVDIATYYPLEVGSSWEYETKKHTRITQLLNVKESDKRGTVEQQVLGVSRLSTKAQKVFAMRNTVVERGSSIAPVVTVETILHLSSSRKAALLHAIDAGGLEGSALPEPIAILEDPPRTGPHTNRAGTLIVTTSVKSQSVEAVEVPAGKFKKALKRVVQGPVSGELSGLPVRSGTVTEITWYAPNVGLVRMERTLGFSVHDEAGAEIRLEEKSVRALKKYSAAQDSGDQKGRESAK